MRVQGGDGKGAMTSAGERRAIIIGGSMAGLFAGHFLMRRGWQVDVYERTPGRLSARGAGIITHPELRAALAALDLDTGPGFGVEIATRVALDVHDAVIATLPCPQIATSWTRVHAMLSDGFPPAHIHAAADLVAIEQTAASITARFADGRIETADVLVGADGLRSTVRAALFPDLEPAYAGYVAWRGLLPEAVTGDGPEFARSSQFAFCLPPGEQMLGYPIAGPNNDVRLGHRHYNFVWYRPADAAAELPALLTDAQGQRHTLSIAPHLIAPSVVAEMRTHAAQVLAPWFKTIVARTQRPFLQPVYDLAVPDMAVGRAVLLGDAAFVVRPHVGGGVVKAADDAQALAYALQHAGKDPAPALAAFSASRHPVGQTMIDQARRLGSYLTHSYGSDTERAAALAAAEPARVLRDTAVLDFLRAKAEDTESR